MREQVETQLSQVEGYDPDVLRRMYRRMREIREFERRASDLSDAGDLPGAIHLYLGQEAVAVGTCLTLRDDDIIGSTHRGHGHVLAKGGDISKMMAELAGKETGLNRGRGGSMHMVDFSLSIFGCNAIVAASVPHVAGGVFSAKLDEDDRIGVAFFGDGATSEGLVHETMNLAAMWDLPMVFLCENNQYAVSTSANDAIAGDQLSDRAAGYGIEGKTINGQNVLTVNETIEEAIETVRETHRPQFIECETYRYSGHFSGEKDLLEDRPYRSDEEIEEWREQRDPVDTFREALTASGTFEPDELADIDEAVIDELNDAVEFARGSDYPPAEKAPEDVYADQDYPTVPQPKYR
jgi:pyruvate dehydrogenase E1 component alpha subunit